MSNGINEHQLRSTNMELQQRVTDLEEKVAEQVKLAEGQQGSQNRYRLLFESSNDGILILDGVTGMVVDVNPFLLQLLGYSYDELCGQYLWELGVFKDIAASKETFKTLQEDKSIRYECLPLETKAGTPISVEFNSNVFLADRMKVIQCNIRDITDRKYAEEKLRISEATYRGILDTITEVVYIKDANGLILDVNHAAQKMYGYEKNEFIGQTLEFVSAEGRNDFSAFRTYLLKAFQGEPQSFEFWGEHRNGTVFPVLVSLCLGNYFGEKVIIAISWDISERKAAEQLLNDVQRREALGVLSSGIAHDFNNLLAVMMGNISLAETQLPPQHSAKKNMEHALKAMESATELTQQMLAYSGKGKAQIRTIDLNTLFRENVRRYTASQSGSVKVVLHLPPSPVYMNGDPGQIKQVIINLIINGRDAIGTRLGVVTVSLTEMILATDDLAEYGKLMGNTLSAGRYARLEVSDTGSGMSKEIMANIFDPFFTTKFIGRGLGLSAVLGIIRGHDGGITLESDEGKGATFRVALPLCEAPVRTIEAATVHIQAPTPVATTVLVIDDESDVAEIVQEILQTENYTVLIELNPIQGIELYKRNQSVIGLVLLDLTMPEMSGKEVMDALREINKDVKIIITSGYSEDEVHAVLGPTAIAGFLQKPYRLKSLIQLVQKSLQ